MTNEEKLTNFFMIHRNPTPLSINERSFQIFGDEKFLSSSEGKSFLNKYHISLASLNIYKTPEPFIYYLNRYTNCKNALIIENKDTWYTMKHILKDYGTICGIPIKALIYGEGRKIQSSFAYIEEEDTLDIHDIQTFYYFGDIDASGLDIFYKLKKSYPGYNITPFEPGYEYLYQHRDMKRKKEMLNNTKLEVYEAIPFEFLGYGSRVELIKLCNEDYIVPQEILNRDVLIHWEETDSLDFESLNYIS